MPTRNTTFTTRCSTCISSDEDCAERSRGRGCRAYERDPDIAPPDRRKQATDPAQSTGPGAMAAALTKAGLKATKSNKP